MGVDSKYAEKPKNYETFENMNNLSYILNHAYYDVNGRMIKGKMHTGKEIAKKLLQNMSLQKGVFFKSDNPIVLQVKYPGLLSGIGNFHGDGEQEDLDGGFSLDYVTGLPYIPATSIKGAIRSAFAHEEYIKATLGKENVDVKKLEEEIFEGVRFICENGEEKKVVISVPKRDVFYDAYPLDYGRIVGIESITPHGDVFDTPNPLSFMKVIPTVRFAFSFKLHDGIITKEEKRSLFEEIIKDFGLGDKTNVGFGVFSDADENFQEGELVDVPVNTGSEFSLQDSRRFERSPVRREKTMVQCECGWKTFKYEKGTQNLSENWKKKICANYRCKKDISGLIDE